MGVRLPSAYQEVDWIETTGTQFIQTDIVPEKEDFVSLVFGKNNIKAPSTVQHNCLYSAGDGTYQFVTIFTLNTGSSLSTYGRFFSDIASQNECYYSDVPSNNRFVWFEHHTNGRTKAQSCTILETGYQFWINSPYKSAQLSGNNTTLRLFARWGQTKNQFVGRAKAFYIERAGRRIIDLVPCYRKSDSKPGMYDLVSGEFFTNAGTGEFVVGPDVIDSISPWLVARRRLLMYKEPELYPVGTHILSMYIGDKDNGQRRKFTSEYGINTSTGEYYATGDGSTYASDVYVPVNPKYTYQKNDWRLNTWCFYDKDKQYISRAPSYNNLNVQTLAKFPDNVCYVRIQAYNFVNQAIEITRIA